MDAATLITIYTLHSGGRRIFTRHYSNPTECTETAKRMRASPWKPTRVKSVFYYCAPRYLIGPLASRLAVGEHDDPRVE